MFSGKMPAFTSTADAFDMIKTNLNRRQLLKSIAVPTLILNAKNDPFLPAWALPTAADVSPAVTLDQPDTGGHVGFPSGPFPGRLDWLSQRLLQHFSIQHG